MKRYDNYKPSGIEWIGDIPSHWEIIPIKYFFYLKGRIGWQGLKADEFKTEGPHLVTGTDFVNGRVDWDKCYRISEERYNEAPEIHVKQGDVLITKDGTVGKLAYIDDKPQRVSLNSHLLIMRPLKTTIKNKYVFWYFHSKPFKIYSELIQDGSIMASLSQEDISNFKLILPSVEEQEYIANYLDKKCAEIDKSIASQQRRIELLEELKHSVITQAVTRGLDPNVPLRDSGIDWIGEIPSHWKCAPLKRFLNINNGADYKHIESEIGYPVMGSGGCFTYATEYMYEGEALLLGRKGTVDRPIYINERFWCVDTMFYATPKHGECVKFMYYVAKLFPFERYRTATAIPSMTQTDLGYNHIAVPPVREQQLIADYLDKRCAEIDGMIEREKKRIELMQELKQSIITEVVTGKRKVM